MPDEEKVPLEEEGLEKEDETQEESQESSEEQKPWEEDLSNLRAQIEEMPAQTAAIVKSVLEASQRPAEQSVTPEAEDLTDAWKLAAQHPEIAQELVRKQVEAAREKDREALRADMEQMFKRRDADAVVGDILGKYRDQISDRDSEIAKSVPEIHRALEAYLSPEHRGKDTHNRLAYALAAANTPEAIAKSHNARQAAEEARREAMRNRASMGGMGSAGTKPATPKINEDLMERLGIDPTDKKMRAIVEKNLKLGQEFREVGDSEGKS